MSPTTSTTPTPPTSPPTSPSPTSPVSFSSSARFLNAAPRGVAVRRCLGLVLAAAALSPQGAWAQILDVETSSMTSYLAGATGVQNLRPRAMQRGEHLDGSGRAGDFFGAIAPGHPGSDGGYNRSRTLSGQLDLALGTVTITDVDMALPAEPGGGWVVGRTYNARQDAGGSHHVSGGPMGNNWATSIPEIALYEGTTDDDDIVYLVAGADRYVEFQRIGESDEEFQAVNGATGVFQHEVGADSEPDTWTLYLPDGTRMVFFGFDGDAGSAAGQFWKKIDPSGNTVFVGDETTGSTAISSGYSSGRVTTVYDETDGDGRRYTYTYNGSAKLTQVEAETKSGGTWASPTGLTTVATVDYSYYGSAESYGSEHDLKTVTITTPMSDGSTDLVQKKYYRYWKGTYDAGSANYGQASAIKYIMEFEGYRQADWTDAAFDDDPLSMAEGDTFKSYSAAYFEYDSSQRITKAWFNGECGCSGATNGVYDLSYGTSGSIGGSYDSAWKLRTVVDRPDGTYVTTYFDEVGQVLGQATTAGDPSSSPGNTWATTAARDSGGRITDVSTPANVTAYTHSTGSFTRASGAGLVHSYGRQSGGSLDGFIAHWQHQEGTGGTAYLDRSAGYTTQSLTVGSATLVSPFMNSVKSVHTEGKTTGTVAAADYDETTTGFTWYSATATDVLSLRPKTITTTLPVVTTATNGSNSANTTVRYLREDGTTAFSEAADDIFTYMEYNDGRLVTRVADADTTDTFDLDPNGHFGITESAAGVHVVTTMTYDAQGRPLATTAPDGDVSMMWFTVLADRTQVSLSAPLVVAGSPDTFHGPAGYSVTSQAGKPVFSGTLFFSGGTTTTDISLWIDETDDMPLEAIATGSATRISTSVYNESGGTLLESRSYFDVPTGTPDWVGTEGTHYDATTFAYDGMGRRVRTVDPTGTISRAVYDTLGRVSSTEVGTDDTGDAGSSMSGTNNMVTVGETVYDSGSDGGNSLVTKTVAHLDDSGTNKRETSFLYDYRGRGIVTLPPTAPYTLVKLDNLGRTLAVAQYSSSSGLDAADDPTTLDGNRLALGETAYDALGRAWKTTRYKVDPDDGSDDDSITSQSWFDAAGRLIKVQGDQLAKTKYDRLGRVTDQFILASDNDSGYGDADDVTGDKVVEQTVTGYESFNSNTVITSATISRPHGDTSSTGLLDTNADGNHAVFTSGNITGRIQIVAYWHDDLDRVTTTGFYGTYGGATFTRPGTVPTHMTADVLVTETSYNDDGTVLDSTDALGTKTRTLYDDAGRQVAQIRNYINGTPSGATGADDLFTRYEYENGQRLTMWVDIDGDDVKDSDDQVTRWVYGVINGADAWDSKVYSNRMLRGIIYPDSSNAATVGSQLDPSGSNGANDDDTVTFAYNAQGEVIWRQDQASGADGGGVQEAGNIIETTYDGSGRVAAGRATSIVGDVDSAVERIATLYDGLGRVSTVTQYDDPSAGSAVDQVEFTYDDWGNVEAVEQNHTGAVGGGGTDYTVSYTYAKSATSGQRQAVRRTAMTMPGGQTLTYNYTDLGSPLSRVTYMTFGATIVSVYRYLGLGMLVGTDLPEPDVGSYLFDTSGGYTHLDRFNRVTTSMWSVDSASPGGYSSSDKWFYDVDITYDDGGNITETVDNVMQLTSGSNDRRFDNLYDLDALGRLKAMDRGHITSSAIVGGTEQETRDWLLSQTGNWAERKIDYDASGTYTGDDLNEDNPVTGGSAHFNKANEWIARDIDDNGSDDYTLTYDPAGNLTDDGKDYTYIYDAFGRLRAIDNRTNADPVSAYRYNGLGWRITAVHNTDADSTLADETEENLVYTDRWQLVAIYEGATLTEQVLPHQAGLDGGGGSSYIDSVILRTTYTGGSEDKRFYYAQNWRADVAVVLDDNAIQQERVSYSPYGQPYALAAGDIDFDADFDSGDDAVIGGWSGAGKPYRAYADVNLDGVVSNVDADDASEHDLGWNVLSSDGATGVNNRIGYAGYTHDRDVPTAAHIRYRVYKIDLGRWTRRDPAGYLVDENLYSYEKPGASSISSVDPSGLVPINYRFNLFIDKRFGSELFPGEWYQPEPVLWSNWWFRTDSRMIGEDGSSRLTTFGSVESTQIGLQPPPYPSTHQGMSVRYHPGTRKFESEQGTPAFWYRTGAADCGSVVHFNAGGSDPFYPWIAPIIKYDVVLRFKVIAPNRVWVLASGWHSAYPSAELFIDDLLTYGFLTPYTKPDWLGVEYDVRDFAGSRILNVPTPPGCVGAPVTFDPANPCYCPAGLGFPCACRHSSD